MEQVGTYRIRLYRWPPELDKTMDATVALGDAIDGGNPYLEGVKLKVVRAKINIQDQELPTAKIVEDRYFEFSVQLEKQPTQFQTFLTDEEGVERRAWLRRNGVS